jgi:ribose transport system ATP-binding protein
MTPTPRPPLLELTDIAKSFGAVRALRGARFDLQAGEIHALAGENGAGKSTLMNIIDGILRPDAGTIRIDGEPVTIDSPARAQALGIGFVHQEIALCADVSVAENIFMSEAALTRRRLMGGADLIARAAGVLARSPTSIPESRSGGCRSRSSSWWKSPSR